MTTLREAAQQALEALEQCGLDDTHRSYEFEHAARAALRAALAQPAPEPVAWRVMLPDGYQFVYDERMLRFIDEGIHATRQPLYTAPPQRKPLTEKEMYIVEEEARKNFRLAQAGPRGQMITYWDSLPPWLIRAVERAHGIKE